MRWKAKAVVQRVFSDVPGAESLNYLCQKRVFRSLPVSDATFSESVGTARRHLDTLAVHGSVPIEQARFYEFGAGKDLI